MAVKGSATVTLSQYRDTESVTRYYKLQSSSMAAPDKPANVKPNETPAGWSKSEPACDITKTLYTCDVTVFSDKTTHVSDVSKSTSYEAAKEAWNKANNAQGTANEAAKTADNYISADSTGIMVSENKGAAKETPSNATKNNVLITEKDVQIRNGQKVVATYGDTITLGEKTGEHAAFTNSGFSVSSKTNEQFSVKGFYEGELFRDSWVKNAENPNHVLDVDWLKTQILTAGKYDETFKTTFVLKEPPQRVAFIFKDGSEMEVLPIGKSENMYYTAGENDSNGETVRIIIVATQSSSTIPWENIACLYVDYKIGYNPATVRIGAGATKDVNMESNGTYYDYKALKIGKGQNREGLWENENALEVNFDGTTSIGGSLNVNGDTQTQVLVAGQIGCSGTINCGELIAAAGPEGEEVSFTTTVSGTGTAKATTGSVSIKPKWWRCGNIVQMEFGVETTGAVNPGKNLATGTIIGIPRPVTTNGLRAASYYGNNANVLFVSQEGNFTVRNCGSDALEKGNNANGIFTYITDGFILGR